MKLEKTILKKGKLGYSPLTEGENYNYWLIGVLKSKVFWTTKFFHLDK